MFGGLHMQKPRLYFASVYGIPRLLATVMSQLFYLCVPTFIVTSGQFSHAASSYSSSNFSGNLEPTANYSSPMKWNFQHYVHSIGTWNREKDKRTKINTAEALDPTSVKERQEQTQQQSNNAVYKRSYLFTNAGNTRAWNNSSSIHWWLFLRSSQL
jgi:hypothetical protein